MKPQSTELLHVILDFGECAFPVGRLALKNRRIYFEYDAQFLHQNFSISPFQLPLRSGVLVSEDRQF